MRRSWLPAILVTLLPMVGDVPWLSQVQTPPASPPAPSRVLSPILSETDLRAPDALVHWGRRRAELQNDWLKWLGPMPARPASNSFEVLKVEPLDGLTRKLIRYENEPGQFLDAYLLEPSAQAKSKRPGLVALHATTDKTNGPIAGVGGRDAEQIGLKLARRGFVVICPRNFLWVDAPTLNDAVHVFQKRHPGTLGITKMLYDAQRATDILAALPSVDPKRLGAVGHSLGAKEVLYLAAFDDRIAASVFSEGGLALDSTNWEAPWYLGPQIKDKNFSRNHHELVALIAPRAFLVLGGESGPGSADGDRSWPYLQTAWPIFELHGRPPRLGLLNHHQGHSISNASFERLADWLSCYLATSTR